MLIKMDFCNVYIFVIILIVYFQVFNVSAVPDKKERAKYIKPFNDEEYDLMVELVKNGGLCSIPVKDRTKGQKNTLLKYWRLKKAGKFTLGKFYFSKFFHFL